MIPRRLHRFYAAFFGYFWIGCPLCGYEFGGHEWKPDRDGHEDSIPADPDTMTSGTAICPRCTRAGKGCQLWAMRRSPWWRHTCEFTHDLSGGAS